jgi:hypothetical protein
MSDRWSAVGAAVSGSTRLLPSSNSPVNNCRYFSGSTSAIFEGEIACILRCSYLKVQRIHRMYVVYFYQRISPVKREAIDDQNFRVRLINSRKRTPNYFLICSAWTYCHDSNS